MVSNHAADIQLTSYRTIIVLVRLSIGFVVAENANIIFVRASLPSIIYKDQRQTSKVRKVVENWRV